MPPTELESKEKELLCDQCGQAMILEDSGVSHHVFEDGEINYNQDARHVAYTTEASHG